VPYAKAITDLGFVGLCIDTWAFGERAHTPENDLFKAMLWQGSVLWGMMVYDSLKAMDCLVTREEVDPQRVATLGISMGSTMAWWLAALDERVKVCVDICCLTDFHTFLRKGDVRRHGVYYYVPGLLKHFTTSDINALIAPRPHLALAGLQDPLTPVEGLDIVDKALQQTYAAHGVPENWKLLRYDVAHQETPEGRAEILRFLQARL
jgi:dienelactone hydrolase